MHLDDNEIVALASGALTAARARTAQEHVDGCDDCRAALVAALRSQASRTELFDSVTHTAATGRTALQLPEGYRVVERIGEGGMGEVHAVRDESLKRTVALKRVRGGSVDPAVSAYFVQEAQLTAQLEHPNIVPVHTLGTLPSGEPYYTMKRVDGRTLDHLLTRLARREEEATPMRLGIVFLQIVQGVAHAHALGVVHGDLKPANILLGAHGEVLVTDWGLARLQPQVARVELSHADVSSRTQAMGGTPRFMSPELRGGSAPDSRSDVWALGAMLYELLTLTPPGESPPAPSVRAPQRAVPFELEEVCLRALSPAAADRFPSAEELRAAMEDALSGVRRRENARRTFAEAEAHLAAYRETQAETQRTTVRLAGLQRTVKPYDGEVQKAPLWKEEEAKDALELAADEALSRSLEGYAQVLGIDPTYEAAAARLADLHLEQFLAAEARGDHRTALTHRRHVERHHAGRHAKTLRGGGVVRFTLSAGQSLEGWRLVERGKRIVQADKLLGSRVFELPMGSYRFVVHEAGKRDTCVAVALARDPDVSLAPRLFTDAEVGDGFVHVPAGPFVYGGDPVALNAAPRQRLELPDFFIARFPVTCGEYLEFLNGAPEAAGRHIPRNKPDGGHLWEPDARGVLTLPRLDADGNPVHPRFPVMGVSHEDAVAYVAWRSSRDGIAYRLPSEEEWEKASRGADGRFFPWGNGFDPSFCKMALSRPGRPQPEPVGSYPADTSVYGMQDCAGAIREWTDSFYDPSRETRVLRGGAWYFNPHYCRLAFRHGYLPHLVFTNFGFRLARSAP